MRKAAGLNPGLCGPTAGVMRFGFELKPIQTVPSQTQERLYPLRNASDFGHARRPAIRGDTVALPISFATFWFICLSLSIILSGINFPSEPC